MIDRRGKCGGFSAVALPELFDMIVWGLASDDHVMHVAFAQAGAGDADELGLLLKFCNAATAEVTHSGTQPTDQLEDHCLERPAIRYAAFNTFRHKLGEPVLASTLALHHTLCAGFRLGEI